MFALKPISRDSLEGALAKAERYRLLNEPSEAESICRDILEVDPLNREARISLILALTDEFPRDDRAFAGAMAEIAVLESAYDRAYYARDCVGTAGQGVPRCRQAGSSGHVYEWIVKALELFEEAERHTAGRQRRLDAALECLRSFSRAPQNRGAEDGRC